MGSGRSKSNGVVQATATVPAGRSAWRLEEAKSRFNEVVRRARTYGPQHVTVRGEEAVVVMSAADFARLAPPAQTRGVADLFGTGPFSRMDAFEEELGRLEPAMARRCGASCAISASAARCG